MEKNEVDSWVQPWIFCSISKPGYLAPFVVIFYHQGECCSIRIKKDKKVTIPSRWSWGETREERTWGWKRRSLQCQPDCKVSSWRLPRLSITFINRDERLDLGLTIAFTLYHSVASALFVLTWVVWASLTQDHLTDVDVNADVVAE